MLDHLHTCHLKHFQKQFSVKKVMYGLLAQYFINYSQIKHLMRTFQVNNTFSC